jgi:hypothetical protein
MIGTWRYFFAAMLLSSMVLMAQRPAYAVPKVIITVDVESSENFPLPEQVHAGCRDGARCSLMDIAYILREHGVAGTFFLNVYEHQRWGEGAMRDIARGLQTTGQDVALHTHPQWAYDSRRAEMYEYSGEEQRTIIEDGIRQLASWTGQPVVAHRAGDYSADERTLMELDRNGLVIDSSLFWGHPHCGLTGIGLPKNIPASRNGIMEIPVTIYQRLERPRMFTSLFAARTSIQKIDVNWLIDEQEARIAVDEVIEKDLPFLVVFLHSFSLIGRQDKDGGLHADNKAQDVFLAILGQVAERGLQVVTFREVAQLLGASGRLWGEDALPQVEVKVNSFRYLWHRLRDGKSGVLAVAMVVVTFFVVWRVWLALGNPKQESNADHN